MRALLALEPGGDLRRALQTNALTLHYQPQYRLRQPTPDGRRSLATFGSIRCHWRHLPACLFQMAEEIRVGGHTGEWVLDRVPVPARWPKCVDAGHHLPRGWPLTCQGAAVH